MLGEGFDFGIEMLQYRDPWLGLVWGIVQVLEVLCFPELEA